ncbi:MAG: glycosyltransferase family 4 protein [Anaerolineales bacterium]
MGDSLRLLMITGEYPPMEGGVADYSRILAQRLAQRGVEVHVLTSTEAGPTGERDGLMVHATVADWSFKPAFAAVSELLEQVSPDVVNIQYQTAAFGMHPAVNLLPRRFGQVPFVITFHDLLVPYLFPKASRLRTWVNEDLARKAAAVVVTNTQDRHRLEAVEGVRRIELIPIGSNITPVLPADYDRETWRRRWGVGTGAMLLCYFGFLNESKGAEELMVALRRVLDRGIPAHLMMIGGTVGASDPTNRAYLERVQERIASLGLRDDVFWTGYMPAEDVSAALVSSDACVLPFRDGASFRRGSLMAALVHGLPVVSTTPREDTPEIVDGVNMLLVPPNDAQALANAIERLWREPALAQRLRQGAQELSRLFDWDQIADRMLALLRSVCRPTHS